MQMNKNEKSLNFHLFASRKQKNIYDRHQKNGNNYYAAKGTPRKIGNYSRNKMRSVLFCSILDFFLNSIRRPLFVRV